MPEGGDFGAGFAMSFANGLMNTGFQQLNNYLGGLISQDFYKENLGYQTEKMKEMFDYEAKYNSPASQMRRLAAAGLNPNLVYGSASPAGIQGNAGSPSVPATEGSSFTSLDVANAMARLKEMQNQQSQIELNQSLADKAKADAEYTRHMSGRYDELVDWQIRETNSRMREAASRMQLNTSTIQYQTAQRLLAEADTNYKNAVTDLVQYQRDQIIAQTQLYRSQNVLADAQAAYYKTEEALESLELYYQNAFYDQNGGMKEITEAERAAYMNELRLRAGKAASILNIESNEVTHWIDWIMSQLGKIFGGAGTAVVNNATRPRVAKPIK